jgi:hypothetical protein
MTLQQPTKWQGAKAWMMGLYNFVMYSHQSMGVFLFSYGYKEEKKNENKSIITYPSYKFKAS